MSFRKSARALSLSALIVLMLSVQLGWSAGFGIYEWSARGNALGGALVGRADDASALAYNPAGITQLDGVQLQVGATGIKPQMTVVTDGQDNDGVSDWWLMPHLYATWKVNDKMSLGVGSFTRYGLGSEFDSDWAGRYNAYNTSIKSLSINPNIAYQVSETLSLAVGVEAMYFDFNQKKKVATPFGDINAHLSGDTVGYGFDLAMHYKPCDYASIGLVYRSQVRVDIDGEANFEKPAMFETALPTWFNDTNARGTITLPDSVSFGVNIKPIEDLSFEVGGVWTHWATYDELAINYDDALTPGSPAGSNTESVSEKDWKNTWRFNAGLEYKTTDWLDLRFGYIYDQSPVQDSTVDYMVPANDRHIFSFGPGFHVGAFDIDLSYSYLYITSRDIEARPEDHILDGESKDGNAHMIGLTVGYKF